LLLTLRFRTEQSFLGASDKPLRCRVSGQHDVGHEGVITECDGFSLRSSIADPQGAAPSPLQSPISQALMFVILTLSNNLFINGCFLKDCCFWIVYLIQLKHPFVLLGQSEKSG